MSDNKLIIDKFVRFNYKGDETEGGSFAQEIVYAFTCDETKKTKTILIRQGGLLKPEPKVWRFVELTTKNNSTSKARDFYAGWAANASSSEQESFHKAIEAVKDSGLTYKSGKSVLGQESFVCNLVVSDDAFLTSPLLDVLEAEKVLKNAIGSSCANRHPAIIITLKSAIAEVMSMGKREVVESTGREEFGAWGSGGSKAAALSAPYVPPVPVVKKASAEISDAWGAW